MHIIHISTYTCEHTYKYTYHILVPMYYTTFLIAVVVVVLKCLRSSAKVVA